MDNRTIYSNFLERVNLNPDSTAVIEDDRSLSFRQLDTLRRTIAAKIKTLTDVTPGETRIGIVADHGAEQIAAMLAVLSCGSAYIPAETFLPKDRIDYMMAEAGVKLVIDNTFLSSLPAIPDLAAEKNPDLSKPDYLAYVLFTSGTTGRPKGVMIENRSVVNYAEAFEEEMQVGPGDVMLQFSVCSFDIFVEEVFCSLLNGVAIAIPSKKIHDGSLKGIMDFCRRHGVTIIDGFPYLIADINKRPALLPDSVRLIISGGDVIRASYISRLKHKGIRIYNTYGPSETTVCATYSRVDNAEPLSDGTFPIGRPIKGVEVRILDKNLREVAAGETGEICILGEGVGRGYLGNPPEGANFITLQDGRRMYRSGDLGYTLPDGSLGFLHRLDDQVMILGKRVEPEEVENVLNEFQGIERGVVRAFEDEEGLHYLVAYIVPREGFSLRNLREWLNSKLVDFMVPEFFVSLRQIPLTHRGKVDMKALPKVLK